MVLEGKVSEGNTDAIQGHIMVLDGKISEGNTDAIQGHIMVLEGFKHFSYLLSKQFL